MAKYKSFGATVQRLISATWTDVAQIASVGDFSLMRETIETTTHDSTGGFREYIGSLRDLEEFEMTLLFDPADTTHVYFRDQVATGTNDNGEDFRTKLSGTATDVWEFTAIVSHFSLTGREIDGRLEATVTFRPTGAPDFSPA